ncbi:MAG TPA: hypothetical protein VK324_05670, partial [Tepidisphaeraceae bacterium]|nr:hypothetical protein [Tepidisphaeraceae bacterium]
APRRSLGEITINNSYKYTYVLIGQRRAIAARERSCKNATSRTALTLKTMRRFGSLAARAALVWGAICSNNVSKYPTSITFLTPLPRLSGLLSPEPRPLPVRRFPVIFSAGRT